MPAFETMIIVRTLVIALLVVAAPLQASAGCSWALWQHISFLFRQPGPAPKEHWAIGEISDSRAECEKKMDAMVKDDAKADPAWSRSVERNHGLVTVRGAHRERGNEIITSYRCLPDTIDPRGPKGGVR